MPVVQRGRPSASTPDSPSVGVANRGGSYGEQYVRNEPGFYADEGTFFVGTNGTLGTGVAAGINTSFAATTPYLTLFNGNSAASNVRIYLDYIKLQVTVTGASSTDLQFVAQVDTGNRFSSGGSAITPVCVNRDLTPTTNATLNVGAITATAATAARNGGHGKLRTVIAVVGDSFLLDFLPGGRGYSVSGAALNGTTPSQFLVPCAPMIIGPQQTFLLNVWGTAVAVTPWSFEFEIGYIER